VFPIIQPFHCPLLSAVAFFCSGKRLECLEIGQIPPTSQQFIAQVNKLFSSGPELVFSPPFYYLWETKPWKAAVDAMISTKKLAMKLIEERMQEIKEEEEEEKYVLKESEEVPAKVDLLTYMMRSGKLSPKELSVNFVDLLNAGVETVSFNPI